MSGKWVGRLAVTLSRPTCICVCMYFCVVCIFVFVFVCTDKNEEGWTISCDVEQAQFSHCHPKSSIPHPGIYTRCHKISTNTFRHFYREKN